MSRKKMVQLFFLKKKKRIETNKRNLNLKLNKLYVPPQNSIECEYHLEFDGSFNKSSIEAPTETTRTGSG